MGDEREDVGRNSPSYAERGRFVQAARSRSPEQSDDDIRFEVGRERVEVAANSVILMQSNNYFSEILRRHFARHMAQHVPAVDVWDIPIQIPNMEPGGFRIMLTYIYRGANRLSLPPAGRRASQRVRLLLETLQCSKVANDPNLESACTRLLVNLMTMENSVSYLNISTEFQCTVLQQKVLAYMGKTIRLRHLIRTSIFKKLSEVALFQLLKYDEWYLPEITVFRQVVKWAENKYRIERGLRPPFVRLHPETLRRAMGRTITAIRFPLMTLDDLREVAMAHPGLLVARERNFISDYLLTQRSSIEPPPFTVRPRRRLQNARSRNARDNPSFALPKEE